MWELVVINKRKNLLAFSSLGNRMDCICKHVSFLFSNLIIDEFPTTYGLIGDICFFNTLLCRDTEVHDQQALVPTIIVLKTYLCYRLLPSSWARKTVVVNWENNGMGASGKMDTLACFLRVHRLVPRVSESRSHQKVGASLPYRAAFVLRLF